MIGEQGEWVVIRAKGEGVGTVGRRVRRMGLLIVNGKVTLRAGLEI